MNPLTETELQAIELAARQCADEFGVQKSKKLSQLIWGREAVAQLHARFPYLHCGDDVPFMDAQSVPNVIVGKLDWENGMAGAYRYTGIAICRKADYDAALAREHQKSALRLSLRETHKLNEAKRVDRVFGRGKLP
jgi:hypothetical protein